MPEQRDNPDYYTQKKTLPQLKKTHPWYAEIYSQVLQDAVKRVKVTFDRFLKGDSNGKRSGRPRFKPGSRYRTFTYPQVKDGCLQNNLINLPMLGKVKVVLHRSIPDGFKIKTVSVTKKADGYYVTLSLEDSTVPEIKPDFNPQKIVSLPPSPEFICKAIFQFSSFRTRNCQKILCLQAEDFFTQKTNYPLRAHKLPNSEPQLLWKPI